MQCKIKETFYKPIFYCSSTIVFKKNTKKKREFLKHKTKSDLKRRKKKLFRVMRKHEFFCPITHDCKALSQETVTQTEVHTIKSSYILMEMLLDITIGLG